jgi:hypothetical protein
MSKFAGFGLVATLLVVVAIACIVLNLYYRPTVERANRGGVGPTEPVLGWRRAIASIVLTPIALVVLPFVAIRWRWRRPD